MFSRQSWGPEGIDLVVKILKIHVGYMVTITVSNTAACVAF